MTISATDLASMMCSRLCHDLLSPVGALSNGLELLAEEKDPEMRARCFELLEQSARISTDKLKFFRLAFGAAGGFGEQVDVAEPHGVIAALVGDNGRIELQWAVAQPFLPKPAVKLLLNLAAIGIEALVRGGTLVIGAEVRGGSCEIAVSAQGPRIVFDENIGKALSGKLPAEELSSRTAPAYMMQLLAAQTGGGVQYALGEDRLVLGAVLPRG
ncbi:MAG: histidine phosphotransferase [Novosphingobium sp.]|nr:histidine phosphotransferase [Novosphingobium sp.]